MNCRKWKTEDSFSLFGRDLTCNKCDHEAKLRKKIRKRRTVQRTRADAARKTSGRGNPQHAQPASMQLRISSTAQAAKPKLLHCKEYVVSGTEERRLFSESHVLFITYATMRWKLELESFELCRPPITTGSSHRRRLGRGLNDDQPINGYVQYATMRKRDQIPMLCTPSDSIEDLRWPKKKDRRNQ